MDAAGRQRRCSQITGISRDGEPWWATCDSGGLLSCTVAGLSAHNSYTFTVAARNGDGFGVSSDPSGSVTPLPDVPGAPTGVQATTAVSSTSVSVTWTAPGRP